jgi:hypothetical protein
MPAWYQGVAPVTITIECGSQAHRITWKRGRLRLDDHDVAAERALGALGGPVCPCLDLFDAWRSPADKRELLWAATAPITPPAGESLVDLRAMHDELVAKWTKGHAPRARAFRTYVRRRWQQSLVAIAPLPLRERLAAAMVVGALRRYDDAEGLAGELPRQIEARALPALAASVAAWSRATRRHGIVSECWTVAADEEPVVCGLVDDTGGWVGLGLPVRWLIDVWARDLALVDGCLVLRAAPRTSTVADVVAVRWERLGAADGVTPVVGNAIALRSDDRRWHLRWTT